mmetsp:Transcript_25172/g.100206  ORF Transcript_25172/g.100206 Transcript_25172/m.100206 type:complete len:247 (-) Transcript_25172:1514-2254(-)
MASVAPGDDATVGAERHAVKPPARDGHVPRVRRRVVELRDSAVTPGDDAAVVAEGAAMECAARDGDVARVGRRVGAARGVRPGRAPAHQAAVVAQRHGIVPRTRDRHVPPVRRLAVALFVPVPAPGDDAIVGAQSDGVRVAARDGDEPPLVVVVVVEYNEGRKPVPEPRRGGPPDAAARRPDAEGASSSAFCRDCVTAAAMPMRAHWATRSRMRANAVRCPIFSSGPPDEERRGPPTRVGAVSRTC